MLDSSQSKRWEFAANTLLLIGGAAVLAGPQATKYLQPNDPARASDYRPGLSPEDANRVEKERKKLEEQSDLLNEEARQLAVRNAGEQEWRVWDATVTEHNAALDPNQEYLDRLYTLAGVMDMKYEPFPKIDTTVVKAQALMQSKTVQTAQINTQQH